MPEQTQFSLLKHAGEPIVLSEAEMDRVTAGYVYWGTGYRQSAAEYITLNNSSTNSTTRIRPLTNLKDSVN